MAVLRGVLPGDLYRRVLVRMPDLVIPAVPNPLLLADFLSASVDQGGPPPPSSPPRLPPPLLPLPCSRGAHTLMMSFPPSGGTTSIARRRIWQ